MAASKQYHYRSGDDVNGRGHASQRIRDLAILLIHSVA